ncbi:MAG: zinc-dependent metalloprotease [Candidatus Cryptobacteroides sp.]
MKIRTILAALSAIAALSVSAPSLRAEVRTEEKKEEQKDSSAVRKPAKKSPYEKLSAEIKQSAEGKFISLHKSSKNKIYIEFRKEYLGRRILAGGTVSTVSDPSSINVGYKYSKPVCFTMELEDTVVVLKTPQTGASSMDPGMEKAMERNYTPNVFKRLSVTAFSPDSLSFFFDATSLINDLQPKDKGFTYKNEGLTTWFSEMKAFDDNASVVINNNMETSRSFLGIKIVTGSGSMSSTVSFLLLPDDLMRPRVQDSRIGVFSTGNSNGGARMELSTEADGFKSYRIANRWRIEPVDVEAWKRGEPTAVRKPVLWYVDDAFPEEWKEPIRKAVLNWNIAFEKLGLKDVMQVRDFPTAEEDPQFDPDNLKYSCIRYIPNATMNAMGPSWVDPVTGEILNASVLVYNDVVRLINNWRFVQTAQVDERVRCKKLPKEVFDESLEYVVTHEIGHTLGLMHNMSASSSFPVDSLRSATFTAKYGTTPSIMDYARFNYVAQPSDKGVRLTPPTLGVYDEYAIDWLYRPVPEASDLWEEAAIREKFIDSKAGDPMFAYGAQQLGGGEYDPSARSEDLGDDPVKAGEYGIGNLKFILSNLNGWIEDDPDYSHRAGLHSQIVTQYNRYIANVLAQIGGIRLRQVKEGTQGQSVSVLPAAVQKESLLWAVEKIKDSEWLDDRTVTRAYPLQAPAANRIAQSAASELVTSAPERIVLAAAVAGEGEAYSLSEYYDDLFEALFSEKRPSSVTMTLQRGVVSLCAKSAGVAAKASFAEESAGEEEPEEWNGILPEGFGEDRAPYLKAVDIKAIDNKAGCSTLFLRKLAKLSDRRRRHGPSEYKAHYEQLYKIAKGVN